MWRWALLGLVVACAGSGDDGGDEPDKGAPGDTAAPTGGTGGDTGDSGVASGLDAILLARQEAAMDLAVAALEAGGNTLAAREEAVAAIQGLQGVADAGVSDDEISIWLDHDEGLRGVLMLTTDDSRGGGGLQEAVYTESPTTARFDTFSVEPQSPIGNRDVLVWAPFATEWGSCNEAPALQQIFEDATCPKLEVDVLSNAAADFASVQDWPDYGTLVLSTHGVMYRGQVLLLTGEQWRPGDKRFKQAKPFPVVVTRRALDKVPARPKAGVKVPVVRYAPSTNVLDPCKPGPRQRGTWIGVLPADVAEIGESFDQGLIFGNFCHSLENDTMADAFLANGARSYFGWTDSVYSRHAFDVVKDFFRSAAGEVKHVDEAYDDVFPLQVGPNPATLDWRGDQAHLYPCLIGAEMTVTFTYAGNPYPIDRVLWKLDPPALGFVAPSECDGAVGYLDTCELDRSPYLREIGEPLFSGQVSPDALVFAVNRTDNPLTAGDGYYGSAEVDTCSSLIAVEDFGKEGMSIWINGSVFQPTCDGVFGEEDQIRWKLLPDGTTECAWGRAGPVRYGPNFFLDGRDYTCTARLRYGHPDRGTVKK